MEEEAAYNEPRDAFVLRSTVWHRSGTAERRTVKVAYFFHLFQKEVKPEVPELDDKKVKVEEDKVAPTQAAVTSPLRRRPTVRSRRLGTRPRDSSGSIIRPPIWMSMMRM
jgi:hypothetical protein